MKQLLKIGYIALWGCLVLTLAACSESAVEMILEINQTTATIPADGGGVSLRVTANGDWQMQSDASWLKLRKEGENASTSAEVFNTGILYLSAQQNPEMETRTANVTLTLGDKMVTVAVSQLTKPQIRYDVKSFDIPAAGGVIELPLTTNANYTIRSLASWIHEEASPSAVKKEKPTFVVDANDSYDDRNSALIVTLSGRREADTIHVTQLRRNALILSKRQITVEAEGKDIELELQANIKYTYKIQEGITWLKEAPATRGLERYSHTLTVATNTSLEARQATVTFTSEDCSLSDEIVIKQEGEKPYLAVDTESLRIDSDGGKFAVVVSSNMEVNCSISESWIKRETTRTVTDATYNFTAEANTSGSRRTASITFRTKDDSKQCVVTVVQSTAGNQVVIRHALTNFSIPFFSGSNKYSVTWGDGSSGDMASGASHTYSSANTYSVIIFTTELEDFDMASLKGILGIDISGYR